MEFAACGLLVEHVDGDVARDVAVLVAAAEGVGHRAAVEVEGHVAVDVGSHALICDRVGVVGHALRAAVDVRHSAAEDVEGDVAVVDVGHVGAAVNLFKLACTARHRQGYVAIDVGHITAAEEGADKLFLAGAGTVLVDGEALGAADGTAGVRAGEGSGVVTAVDESSGVTEDIGCAVGVGGRVPSLAGVGEGVSIAAGEESVDTAALHLDDGVGEGTATGAHIGGTAATVDHLHCILATIDGDGSATAGSGSIAGLVAAAIDALNGKVRGIVIRGDQGIHIGEGGHLVGGVVGRVVDVHHYIARRRTVLVVGTKDILADDHAVVAGDAGGLGGCVVRAADVHRDVAAYVGSIVGIAQTAAVDAFIHPAAFDGDGGRLVARGSTHSG